MIDMCFTFCFDLFLPNLDFVTNNYFLWKKELNDNETRVIGVPYDIYRA